MRSLDDSPLKPCRPLPHLSAENKNATIKIVASEVHSAYCACVSGVSGVGGMGGTGMPLLRRTSS
jgi:hypothetical protein